MNALAKAHQQMTEDGAPPELLRGVPQPSNGNLPAPEATAIARIIEMARDTSLPLDRLEKVLEMQQQIEARKDERAFNEAMARAQAEMRTVALDSSNPQTRSRYASYAALDRAIRPHYTRHGFALSFNTGDGAPENCVRVLCDVSCGGHSRRYHIDMPADGKGAKGGDVMTKTHATGSAISYGQRYLLKMIFNVSTGEVEDDGNAAGSTAITPDQAERITKLVQEARCNIDVFLRLAGAPSISDIPAAKFDRAVAWLMQKIQAGRR